ncbi:cell division protein ZapA [Dasania sp. GY-MA-18]|uniref:Cell division protein ZapA n=1 Tax=Dasania phycosphaerae TaxID=2950436 RepID=A0A9J6RK52_9GAMM|nr:MULTISPECIES: cell division protein ZapA [Dasania]MCR8922180.1 cell division protein ZapA [Dasania sp. GY-MA-18]MCZ0864608.1 cell division protein ZapA [Dasania phycosphaerae]MCZ0868336.1 cell division protein ZapA [Dasania phycosphaerae]
MSSNGTVTVKILGKDYQIACPEGQEQALQQSAAYLDQKMAGIRKSGKVLGVERIAVMAALNISHELLENGPQTGAASKANSDQINKLGNKIDEALHRFRQLDIG